MLYSNQIKNYEDFRERFGYKTGAKGNYLVNKNGVRQRKNHIVYQYFKASFLSLRESGLSLTECWEKAIKFNSSQEVYQHMLWTINTSLNRYVGEDLSLENFIPDFDVYKILNHGICLDENIDLIQYTNTTTNKSYKMKIGKYIGKFLDSIQSKIFWYNNLVLRTFFIEEISEKWKNHRLSEKSMKVVVDDDFEKIYTRSFRTEENQDFRSCMDDKSNWNYYAAHPDLYKAISLQDEKGNIYARSILVTCSSDDNKYILLERIYYNKRIFRDVLFEKAKQQNLFNLYKDLNASCHDSTLIKDVTSDELICSKLHIPLSLKHQDWISYQDTFKFYYPKLHAAFNARIDLTEKLVRLDITESNYLRAFETENDD